SPLAFGSPGRTATPATCAPCWRWLPLSSRRRIARRNTTPSATRNIRPSTCCGSISISGSSWMPRRSRAAAHGRPALPPDAYAALRLQVLDRDHWRCRNPLCRKTHGLEVDHVIPRSQGGPDTLENLIALCGACHRLKHDGVLILSPSGTS